MTPEQVESKVKEIIVEQLGVDEAQVEGKASFVEAFEEAFEIDIPDEDTEKIATVQNAVEYISSKKK
jgi:acyl carrier protein